MARDPKQPPEAYFLRSLVDREVVDFQLPCNGRVTIGRAPECEICLADAGASRRHAAISVAEVVTIEDLGSANGTFVVPRTPDDVDDEEAAVGTAHIERRRLEPGVPVELARGDVIHLGSAVCTLLAVHPPGTEDAARGLIVRDPVMASLYELVDRIADAPISVLILGETGVGKEVLAESIVARSSRADKPFVRFNCAAFQESLLESELFGFERGAFTGANKAKPGLFEAGDGGTVFLDEVAEIPLSTQVKLLRVLEARQVRRIGAVSPRNIDVRFISATNRNLEEESRRGSFREDLYFRLNGVTVFVPPLRERKGEIEPLARSFMNSVCHAAARRVPALSHEALDALTNYTWRGNIRELKNVVERAVLLSGNGPITLEHLPPEVAGGAPGTAAPTRVGRPDIASEHDAPSPEQPKSEVDERERIIRALQETAGNQTRAAKLLGVSRTTLSARLDQYGIARPRK